MQDLTDILEPGRQNPNMGKADWFLLGKSVSHLKHYRNGYNFIPIVRIIILFFLPLMAQLFLTGAPYNGSLSMLVFLISMYISHFNFLYPLHGNRNQVILYATLVGFLVNMFSFAYWF